MGKKKRSPKNSQDIKSDKGKSWVIMNHVKPPDPFDFQDLSSWQAWIKHYKMFHTGVGLLNESEDQQINMLLYCMGSKAEDLLDSQGLTEGKRTSFNSVVATIEDYFLLKENSFYNRVLFLERNQMPGEKIDCYVNDLSKLAEKCDWSCKNCKSKDLVDEIVLLKLIVGLNDKILSKHLQRQKISSLAEVKLLIESKTGEKSGNIEIKKDVKTMTIAEGSAGTYPSKLSACVKKENVGYASFTPAPNQQIVPKRYYYLSENSSQEENGSMRSSFSSGVGTGDEITVDELPEYCYFHIVGEKSGRKEKDPFNFEQKVSPSSFCADQRPTKQCCCSAVNCRNSTNKSNSNGTSATNTCKVKKPTASEQYQVFFADPFDFESEEEYVNCFSDFNQKNYLSYTSSKTSSSSVKPTYTLDDSWSEEKTSPKLEDKPKSFDNYHFSVSGHQSRRSLRKMCQQTLKNSY